MLKLSLIKSLTSPFSFPALVTTTFMDSPGAPNEDIVQNRLQNSPYFCVFKYAPAVNKRSGMRLKTESETGERSFFSVASHALRACEARAPRARKTLTPRFNDFFTDFEKKTDCFAV